MNTFPDERADRLLIAGILFALLVVIALLVLTVSEVASKERQIASATARVHDAITDHSAMVRAAHRTPTMQEVDS
jgi:hypothetical protein